MKRKSKRERLLKYQGAIFGLAHVTKIAEEQGIEITPDDGTSKVIAKIINQEKK